MSFSCGAGKVEGMSTKAQAMLEEIQALPPAELRELCQQINRMAAETEKLSSHGAGVGYGV